ncbi:MAG: FMN-binding protein [Planctomycetaceae bacterium]|nr:FMN-binding protein [Planctomycetaceae bacterium]
MVESSQTIRVWLMQFIRAAIFCGIILSIHLGHARRVAERPDSGSIPLELEQVLEFFPQASSLEGSASGTQIVKDKAGETLGYVLQTSPISDDIVGYSGPTNSLLAFEIDDRLIGMRILESADTREHVNAIQQNERFRFTWNGLPREEAANLQDIDAVSGSTLTSMAIQQGIQKRLGGDPPNLKFPREITLEEVKALFPQASSLRQRGLEMEVLGPHQEPIGLVLRSSPHADQVIGYQGPTDVLLGFDAENQFVGFRLRESYDNDPYVDYVREDDYFRNSLNGNTPLELSQLDLIEDQIEGVSGATMTSQGVAETLISTAKTMTQSEAKLVTADNEPSTAWSPAPRDYGTLGVLLVGLILAFTKLRGFRFVRIGYQITLILYLGFLNGDMVSQAFLAGAAQHGLPWRSAFGLSILTLAALIVPLTTRRQVYCHQICPHGALQQLIKGRFCAPRTVPRRLDRALRIIPPALLLVTVLTAMRGWSINLAAIEPFDAYLFQVAGVGTISVAVIGLIVSLVVPMAYCHYGCPTGAMLGFLRRHGRSDQWSRRDTVALGLLIIAIALLA